MDGIWMSKKDTQEPVGWMAFHGPLTRQSGSPAQVGPAVSGFPRVRRRSYVGNQAGSIAKDRLALRTNRSIFVRLDRFHRIEGYRSCRCPERELDV
jgi:hypothetical protein